MIDVATQTDPIPFIAFAYGVGATLLSGYGLWLMKSKRKLVAIRQAMNPKQGESRRHG